MTDSNDSPEGNYALAHPTLGTIVFEVDADGWATISLSALQSLVDRHDELDAQLKKMKKQRERSRRDSWSQPVPGAF